MQNMCKRNVIIGYSMTVGDTPITGLCARAFPV